MPGSVRSLAGIVPFYVVVAHMAEPYNIQSIAVFVPLVMMCLNSALCPASGALIRPCYSPCRNLVVESFSGFILTPALVSSLIFASGLDYFVPVFSFPFLSVLSVLLGVLVLVICSSIYVCLLVGLIVGLLLSENLVSMGFPVRLGALSARLKVRGAILPTSCLQLLLVAKVILSLVFFSLFRCHGMIVA